LSTSLTIIGGAGRLGKSLAILLRDRGYRVKVFDLPVADFSGLVSIDQVKGNITDIDTVKSVIRGADVVIHLAALLPPKSEANREVTWNINVGGTKNIIHAISSLNPSIQLIFSSSVTTYGDNSKEKYPIGVNYPQHALDIYAETKIASEAEIKASPLTWTILRIAGIAVPEFLEPPQVWPFQREQRVEFVNCADAALAIANCVENSAMRRKVLNISGGPSWQMLGWQYVKGYYDIYELPLDSAKYQDNPGWTNWYDTDESQRLLAYQQTSWKDFLDRLAQAAEEAMG
jgi:nucleoside-diphosphate-sugar epimerase